MPVLGQNRPALARFSAPNHGNGTGATRRDRSRMLCVDSSTDLVHGGGQLGVESGQRRSRAERQFPGKRGQIYFPGSTPPDPCSRTATPANGTGEGENYVNLSRCDTKSHAHLSRSSI